MSKYVPDISTRRWVLISPQRTQRPKLHDTTGVCIFCPGNEKLTPGEVFRIGKGNPDQSGWLVRVIPNKYPLTDLHEIIIHSPWASKDIENLPLSHVKLIFETYRQRFNTHKNDGQVIIFCNHGRHAGASVDYPHSQLVVIPHQINLDTLEKHPLQNTVFENNSFQSYCPDFSQWPYEVWIIPKSDDNYFGDITDEEIEDLSALMKKVVVKLEKIYDEGEIFDKIDKKTHPFGYNYYIYPKKGWYLRIIPRFVHRAGFELGTGLSVNVIDPIDAAEQLKK